MNKILFVALCIHPLDLETEKREERKEENKRKKRGERGGEGRRKEEEEGKLVTRYNNQGPFRVYSYCI